MKESSRSASRDESVSVDSAMSPRAAAAPEKQRFPHHKSDPGAKKVELGGGVTVAAEKALRGSKEHGKLVQVQRREKGGGRMPDEKKKSAEGSSERRKSPKSAEASKAEQIKAMVNDMLSNGETQAAIDVVASAMTDCCREVQEYCDRVLFDLARKDSANRSNIVHSKALAAIVENMKARGSDAAVQEKGCSMLWLLALDEGNRDAIEKAGGCARLIEAIVLHKDVGSVVAAAFGAVKPFSFDVGGRMALQEMGAARAVACAMMANSETKTLQSEGCGLLSNLAVDIHNRQVSVATSEEIKAIFEAMLQHPESLAVQKQACFALKNFSYSERNLQALVKSELPLEELLDFASKTFSECKGDAETVLNRLAKFRQSHDFHQQNVHGVHHQQRSRRKSPPQTQKSQKAMDADYSRAGLGMAGELMNNALSCGQRGEYQSALSQLGVCLKMKVAMYSPGAVNSDLVYTLHCIGYVSALCGDFAGSIEKYKESLAMQERIRDVTRGAKRRDAALGIASTMTTIGMLYIKHNNYDIAEDYLTKAMEEKRNICDSGIAANAAAAKDLENLGDLNRLRGRYEKAEELYTKSALHYKGSNAVESQLNLSNVISKLAALSGTRGENAVAQKRFGLALEIKRRAYGPSAANADLVVALNNLGYVRAICGDDLDAIGAYMESVDMQRRILGADSVDDNLAQTLSSLGVLHMKCGDPRTARDSLEEALDMKMDVHGDEAGGDFLGILTNLGEACSLEGDLVSAEVYYQEALRHADQRRDSKRVAEDILLRLGDIASERGDFSAAHGYYSRALDITKDPYGSHATNNDLVQVLNHLGYVCAVLSDYAVAIDKYELSLKMQQNLQGPGAVGKDLVNTLENLGILYLKRQSYGAAQKYLTEALAMKRRMYGEDAMNADIASTLRNLGDVHKFRKEFLDAERLFQESLEMLDSATELDDESLAEMADIRMELGTLAGIRGDVCSAKEHFQVAIEMKKEFLYGPCAMNLDLVESLNKLGYVNAIYGNYRDAITQYEESFSMQQQIYSNEPETGNIADTLTSLEILHARYAD